MVLTILAWLAFVLIGVCLLALFLGDMFDIIDTGVLFGGSPLMVFLVLLPVIAVEALLFEYLF